MGLCIFFFMVLPLWAFIFPYRFLLHKFRHTTIFHWIGEFLQHYHITMSKVHGSLARAEKLRGQMPKVTKRDKKKKPRGCTHKRMQYNCWFVTAVVTFGKMRGQTTQRSKWLDRWETGCEKDAITLRISPSSPSQLPYFLRFVMLAGSPKMMAEAYLWRDWALLLNKS